MSNEPKDRAKFIAEGEREATERASFCTLES